jgi:hypothetical protein
LAVTSARPKVVVSSTASVSKVAVTVISLRASVLRINVGTKRPSAATSPTTMGKHARVDIGPVLTSTAPSKVCARSRVSTEPDEDRVAYCPLLDFVPSESGSSSGETSGSESILSSPSLVPYLRVSAEIPSMMKVPEAGVTGLGILAEAGAHAVAIEGLLFLAL